MTESSPLGAKEVCGQRVLIEFRARMLATVAAYVLDVVSSYILVAPRVLGGSVSANKGIKFGLLKGSS